MSLGLTGVFILAGGAGLVLLIGVVIVAIIMTRRKQSGAQSNDSTTSQDDKGERTTMVKKEPRSRGLWKWVALLVLLALCVLPLLAVVGPVLMVIPVRSERSPTLEQGMEPSIHVVEALPTPAVTQLPTLTEPGATSTDTPQPASTPTGNTRADLGLNPFSELTTFVVLPGIAGLVLFVSAAAVALVVKSWSSSDPQSKDTGTNGDDGRKQARMAKLRYGLLAFVFWFALSVFFILDLHLSVSLYVRFVAIYAAFWVLVGALLLWGRPRREKLLILALLVLVLFSVRFVSWTSRKPFLKDLYSIKEGMTVGQVKQIMSNYRVGGGNPLALDGQKTKLDEQGEIVTGGITYLHTKEGWGNSDWGVVIFEDGRVVQTRFLPD